MKKPKFNIDIFFKAFAKENITKHILDRPHMLFDYALSKGFGYEEEKDYNYGRDWINPDYSLFENPKKSFNNFQISSSKLESSRNKEVFKLLRY